MVVGSMRIILKLRKRGAILSVTTPPSVRRYLGTRPQPQNSQREQLVKVISLDSIADKLGAKEC